MMSRLVSAELGRLRSRRITWFLVLGALLLIGVTTASNYVQSKPPTAAETAQVDRMFEEEMAHFERTRAQLLSDCQINPRTLGITDPAQCEGAVAQMAPQKQYYGRPVPTMGTLLEQAKLSAAVLGVLLSLVLGASLVAAEHATGSMANWLTFEPRRMPVLLSKLVVAGIAGALLTAGIVTVWYATAPMIASARGLDSALGTASGGVLTMTAGEYAAAAGRTVVLGAWAAVIGASLAFLFRHTAAVIAVVAGYLFLVELGGAIMMAFTDSGQRFMLTQNAAAWVNGELVYLISGCNDIMGADCEPVRHVITAAQGGAALLLVGAIVFGLGWWRFTRTDVT